MSATTRASRRTSRTRIGVFAGSTVALATALVLTACAASPSADSPSSTASAGLTGDVTAAVDTSAVIGQLSWGAAQTVNGVTYDGTETSATLADGTVTIASNGIPNHERDQYYAVGTAGVQLPNASNSQLVTDPTSEQDQSFSIPTRPEYSDTTTAAPLGSIGIMISGAVIFNPYEADNKTVAMSSNFTLDEDGKTGSFIDQCAGHPGPGGEYHYHGNSECVTRQVDDTGGGSHIIGLALDGYPIYGAYDIDGVEQTGLLGGQRRGDLLPTIQGLDVFPGYTSGFDRGDGTWAINNKDQIAGAMLDLDTRTHPGFVMDKAGNYTLVWWGDPADETWTAVLDISDNGTLAGTFDRYNYGFVGWPTRCDE